MKITSVDSYGYLGRENHPRTSDIGLEVIVISSERFFCGSNGREDSLEDIVDTAVRHQDTSLLARIREIEQMPDMHDVSTDECLYDVYEVATLDGRRLTLISHEVSL